MVYLPFFYLSYLKLECQKENKEAKKEGFNSIFCIDLCVDNINAFYAMVFEIESIGDECRISRISILLLEHN